jgi:hypothetical protein
MIVDARAASTLKITCSGNLTNTPADGVTLGQCDLNFISVKELTEIVPAPKPDVIYPGLGSGK